MENAKKSERTQKREKFGQSDGKGVPECHYQQEKKDRGSARHSYHQGIAGSFNTNGLLFDGPPNNNQYGEHRSLVSRERSFIRHQPTYAHSHSKEIIQQKRRSGMAVNHRGKPAMEIYRPPTLRGSNGFEGNGDPFYSNGKSANGLYDSQGNFHSSSSSSHNSHYHHGHKKSSLNIHAKEFISFQGPTSSSLHHSKSSGNVVSMFQKEKGLEGLQHSKSGHNLRDGMKQEAAASLSKVHFSENKENDPEPHVGMTPRTPQSSTSGPSQTSLKRSKSLGSADLRQAMEGPLDPLGTLGPFSQEVHKAISEAMNDPNQLSARQLMESVRHVFSRVIESSRYSEPTARICINIIEKEKGETFLETLLNTCQEFYQERDRLLRNTQTTPYPGYVASHPRWIAYMSFLNEMYTQLKRRHIQLMTLRMRNSETPPGLHLLTLLAQCCYVCLREPSVNSLSETECLFFVLTAVGKDIEVKLPQHMARVIGAARDAFLISVHVPAVRKTLLQLIEMNAARWQLPAPAVMYYYPGSGAK